MNNHSTLAAVLAIALLGGPMVSQAQDPAEAFKQVQNLTQAGKAGDAIKLCDQVINTYGNPKSRVAQQFIHMVPFFIWQKADILFKAKEYQSAYDTYKRLATETAWKDKGIIARANEINKKDNPLGYQPYLTMSQFYMGYCRFQQAVGTAKAPGDPALFADSITDLEAYLSLYTAGKVSPAEKKAKLDGTICFLLMQAYILKPEPDFKKAGDYLEKSRTARAPLTDEMAMGGLNSVVSVAKKHPEYIEWCHKVVSSNPESFDLGPARMAPYGDRMLNYGAAALGIANKNLQAGKLAEGVGALRSAECFFGLVPNSPTIIETLKSYTRRNQSKRALPDPHLGTTFNPEVQTRIIANYEKLTKTDHKYLEAFATQQYGNVGYMLGSARLAKASYKILIDRYPDLVGEKDGKPTEVKDQNIFNYSNLCRLTGDEEAADKYEKMVDSSKVADGGKKSINVNKMARAMKEKRWADVIPAAESVMKDLAADKQDANYVTAQFAIVAAHYSLKDYAKAAASAEEFIASGALDSPKLKEKQKATYGMQARFFVVHSYSELGKRDSAARDKAIDAAMEYVQTYPSANNKENPYAPNVYYFCIDALLRRATAQSDDKAKAADMERALRYCDGMAEKWPDLPLTPNVMLIGAKILVNGDDDDKKPDGLLRLEKAAQAAFKHDTVDNKNVAAEALFLLASYSGEFDREGEDPKAKDARIAEYIKQFWEKADREGNPFALQMVAQNLMNAADGSDAAAFNTSVTRAQEVIAREGKYGMEHDNNFDPELEKTINTYASAYVDGTKKHTGKELTLEEKTAHFSNFPGIDKNNKYVTAILRMAMINAMSQAQSKARKDHPDVAAQLGNDIASSMRALMNDFRPEDLTNFICVQVGKNATENAAKLPDPTARDTQLETALSYFNKVIERNSDRVDEAKVGKADALALSSDKAKQTESGELYKELCNSRNPEVSGPALVGVTKLYLATGDYKAAQDSAQKFIDGPMGRGRDRLPMLMMLGEAAGKAGDVDYALQTYINLYNQNIGNILYSAPACKAMMELYWNRNKPSTGDRMGGKFKASDRWRAWNTGQDYVTKIKKNGIDKKMRPDERDLFAEVEKLVDVYSKDADVQKEDKENKEFATKVGKKR